MAKEFRSLSIEGPSPHLGYIWKKKQQKHKAHLRGRAHEILLQGPLQLIPDSIPNKQQTS